MAEMALLNPRACFSYRLRSRLGASHITKLGLGQYAPRIASIRLNDDWPIAKPFSPAPNSCFHNNENRADLRYVLADKR
jgi:hypothetical protein